MTGYIIGIIIGALLSFSLTCYIIFLHLRNKRKKHHNNSATTKNYSYEKIAFGKAGILEILKEWASDKKGLIIERAIIHIKTQDESYFDLAIISPSGLVLVLIKSISGTVRTDSKGLNWVRDYKGEITALTNPVAQNDKSINLLKPLLLQIPIVSCVVYTERTTNIELNGLPAHAIVIKHEEIAAKLLPALDRLPNKLNANEIKEVYSQLSKVIKPVPKNAKQILGNHDE